MSTIKSLHSPFSEVREQASNRVLAATTLVTGIVCSAATAIAILGVGLGR